MKMQLIYARYNKYHNSIDITTFDGYLLRIDCKRAEQGLKVTPNSQCVLNALAVDEPCLLYTSPSPRDPKTSRMPSSA